MNTELKFKPWQGIYLSFYNREFYKEVLQKWNYYGFSFFSYVLLISQIFLVVVSVFIIRWQIKSNIEPHIAKTPQFYIHNSKCEFNFTKPYTLEINQHNVLYLDPIDDDYDKKIKPIIQLSPHRYFINNSFMNTDTSADITTSFYDQSFNFNKNDINKYFKYIYFLPALSITLYPVFWVVSLIGFFLTSGVVAMVFKLININLNFEQIVRANVIASVPNRILEPLYVSLILIYGINPNIFALALWCFYLMQVIKSIEAESQA